VERWDTPPIAEFPLPPTFLKQNMSEDLLELIPGYREAVEAESAARDAAFLDGWPELVCDVELRPLTLVDMLALARMKSPFILGGSPSPQDVLLLLWHQRYGPRPAFPPDQRKRDKFMRGLAHLNFASAVRDIRRYVDDSFADAPGSSGDGTSVAPTSWGANLVSSLAREFGWSERDILDMPLKRAWQYWRCIQLNRNPGAIMFNGSDRVRSAWLARNSKAEQS
jgi:hypothetical protein